MKTIAVIGSGFSGISVCYSLIKQGFKPVLINVDSPQKASNVPIGILNPATGRRALPAWHYADGLHLSFSFLEELQEYTKQILFKKTGIIRTAMNEEMASAYQKAEHSYADTHVKWLDSNELQNLNSNLYTEFGGLWIEDAATFSGEILCKSFDLYLKAHQIETRNENVLSLKNKASHVEVTLQNDILTFDKVVLCGGAVLPIVDGLNFSKLIVPVKGELLRGKQIQKLPFDFSLVGFGHLSELNNEVVFGSTYEHDFDEIIPTEAGKKTLIDQLSATFPEWKKYINFTSQWSGLRASTPDRMPFIGNFDFDRNIYFYIGNGSKGMIWSFLLGSMLVDSMINGTEILKPINVKRFEKRVL